MAKDEPKKTNAQKGIKRRKTRRELQPSSENNKRTKKLAEDDHDHKTVLNVDSKQLKTVDGKKEIKTSKIPLKSEDDEPWNPNKPIPEDFVPWLEHDHDKCVAEELGLDLDAPIPAHYADYFYNQATPSPEGSFNLYYSESELAKLDPLDIIRREPTPPIKFRSTCSDSSSSPSDGNPMDLGSDDDSNGLGGPITSSKAKKRKEAYKKQLELESRPDAKTAEWLKMLDEDEARWKPTN